MNTELLFQPFESDHLQLKNRVVMAPMTRSQSPGHTPNDRNLKYYQRRAAHEVGLILTEGVNISHPASAGYPDVPVMFGEALAAWEKLVKAVHTEGGKIAPQLWHVGALRSAQFDPENKVPSASPSGIYPLDKPAHHKPYALSTEETEQVIDSFIEAAKQAQSIGFDAVEIHGAHGYLVDQFFWSQTNKRTDRFGGETLADRTTFACEVIKGIKQRCGESFAVIFRFSNWKLGVYEKCLFQTPEDLSEFLNPLVNAGVDIFHASSRNLLTPEFDGSHLNLAGWTKKLTQKPCISVGSVGLTEDFIQSFSSSKPASLEALLQRLNNHEFDLVAVGRALIGDPAWAEKVKQQKFSDIKEFTKDCLDQLI